MALLTLAAPVLAAALTLADAPKADFFVAPGGNDAWSGRRADPAPGGGDGPFATLDRARKAVRGRPAARAGAPRPVVVMVRGGWYELPGPLVLTPEDSGAADSPVVYEAFPGERPVLSGGTRLKGWARDGRGRWRLELPAVRRGEWSFSQLFVDGARKSRPRLPAVGYAFVAGEVAPAPAGRDGGANRFRARPGDVRAEWAGRGDVEVLAFHTWKMSRMRVASVDASTHVVTLTGHTPNAWTPLARGDRFLVEDVPGGPTAAGEWSLDRKAGVLTYQPERGEDPVKAVVVAPRLEALVDLRGVGDGGGRRWVEHVRFRGLTFAHAAYTLPAAGHAFHQSDVDLPAAVRAVRARGVTFEGCTVEHVGAYAVSFGAGCTANRVERCVLTDLGGGGVMIGEVAFRPGGDLAASHNVVRDSVVAHAGRTHPASVGVWIGQAHHNVVEGNAVHDLYSSGISAGWTWGYGESHAHDNRIEANDVSRVGQGVTSDIGGIYTLGVSPGTVIRGNRVRDVQGYEYGGWGLYFDEGTSGVVARDNLVAGTTAGGFHLHFGKDNLIENNVFARPRAAQLTRSVAEPHTAFTFRKNVVLAGGAASLLEGDWSGKGYVIDENLYWDPDGRDPRFGRLSFPEWQSDGHDTRSVVADPRFAGNPDAYRLAAGSPASALGIRPLDAAWDRPRPASPSADAPRAFPPPPALRPLDDDFEATAEGERPEGATANEVPPKATVRVTGEAAASGRRSLKFTDAPGLKQTFYPYAFYRAGLESGSVTLSFDVKLGSGSVLWHEWRDGEADGYRVGPSLKFAGDGTLLVRGRALTRVPHGRWVTVEVAAGLGGRSAGRYDLTVRVAGEPAPRRFPGLACAPEFRALRWLGVFADADGPGVFYLDNLRIDTTPR